MLYFYAFISCRYIEIGIESGLPVSFNGKELLPASLLVELNKIGGKHGIGQIDMVENRLAGMKSHEAYETLGRTILFSAVQQLESKIARESMQLKDSLALKYAELISACRKGLTHFTRQWKHLWKKSPRPQQIQFL